MNSDKKLTKEFDRVLLYGDRPKVEYISPDRWRLEEDVHCTILYVGGFTVDVTVPKGFTLDCASIPEFVLPLFGKKPRVMLEAAVVHDYLYETQIVSRKVADQVMLDIMVIFGNPASAYKRWLIYNAVRMFGAPGFKVPEWK